MKTQVVRKAGVAWAAVVTLIFAAAAFAGYPSIVSSFPLTGATPPDPRGIHHTGNNIHVISVDKTGENYLYRFTWDGSFISSVILPEAHVLADADHLPEPYPIHYFGAVDIISNDVKIYNTDGSFVGTFLQAPTNTVAFGVGGHVFDYVYFATREGVVFRYTSEGSLMSSFATGIEPGDVTGSGCYGGAWGDYVQITPRGLPGPILSYYARSGVLVDAFQLPGLRNSGSLCFKTVYYCIRVETEGTWVYKVDLGRGMAVEPASLGKVKALFK